MKPDLVLEGEDMSNATIHGVVHACKGLVADHGSSIAPGVQREVQQHLRDVARTKDLVDSCELS